MPPIILQTFLISALRSGIFLIGLNARGHSCIEWHRNHCLTIKVTNHNRLLLGDSMIARLARYQTVWRKYLVSLNKMNLGISGDCVEYLLWRAISLPLPPSVRNIVAFNAGLIISRLIPLVILLIALLM